MCQTKFHARGGYYSQPHPCMREARILSSSLRSPLPSLSLSHSIPFPLHSFPFPSLLTSIHTFLPFSSPPFPFSIFFLPFLPFLPSVSSPYFPSLFPSVPFPLSSLPFLSSPLFPSPSLPLPLSFFPFYPPFSFSLLSHISLSLSFPFSFPDKELDCLKPI